jgi:hypothetical protein
MRPKRSKSVEIWLSVIINEATTDQRLVPLIKIDAKKEKYLSIN